MIHFNLESNNDSRLRTLVFGFAIVFAKVVYLFIKTDFDAVSNCKSREERFEIITKINAWIVIFLMFIWIYNFQYFSSLPTHHLLEILHSTTILKSENIAICPKIYEPSQPCLLSLFINFSVLIFLSISFKKAGLQAVLHYLVTISSPFLVK